MRSIALALAVVLASAGTASAVPTTLGGSISILVGTLPPLVFPVATGVGDLSGATLTVPAGIASTTGLFVPVSGFPLNLITGLVVTASNGAGSFSVPGPADGGVANVPGGGFGGTMPILGVVQIKGPLALNVPISVVGAGGSVSVGGLQIEGAPWTTGLAKVTLSGASMAMFAASGSMAGPLGGASSTLTLVTPARIHTGGFGELPVFATWSLHFIPEPASGLLFAAGLVGLASASRARRGTSGRYT